MKIAVIPARGGSKRIPRKNIKVFDGLPMIAYAISAALNTKLFDHLERLFLDNSSLNQGCSNAFFAESR